MANIVFKDGNKTFDVPEEFSEQFQMTMPNAVRFEVFKDGDKLFDVPSDKALAFSKAIPTAYLYDESTGLSKQAETPSGRDVGKYTVAKASFKEPEPPAVDVGVLPYQTTDVGKYTVAKASYEDPDDIQVESIEDIPFESREQELEDWQSQQSPYAIETDLERGIVMGAAEDLGLVDPDKRSFVENIGESLATGMESTGASMVRGLGAFGVLGDEDKYKKAVEYNQLQRMGDPIEADNFLSNILHQTAQMAPAMTAGLLLNYALPGSGMALWGVQGMGDIYHEMDAAGVDKSIALPVSVLGGAAYSLVESFQGALIMGGAKGLGGKTLLKKMLKNQAFNKAIKSSVGQFLRKSATARFLSTIGVESFEEATQSLIESASSAIGRTLNDQFKGTDLLKDMDFNEEISKASDAFVSSLGPMGIMTVGGRGMKRFAKFAQRHELKGRRKKLNSELNELQNNPVFKKLPPEEQKLITQEWQNRISEYDKMLDDSKDTVAKPNQKFDILNQENTEETNDPAKLTDLEGAETQEQELPQDVDLDIDMQEQAVPEQDIIQEEALPPELDTAIPPEELETTEMTEERQEEMGLTQPPIDVTQLNDDDLTKVAINQEGEFDQDLKDEALIEAGKRELAAQQITQEQEVQDALQEESQVETEKETIEDAEILEDKELETLEPELMEPPAPVPSPEIENLHNDMNEWLEKKKLPAVAKGAYEQVETPQTDDAQAAETISNVVGKKIVWVKAHENAPVNFNGLYTSGTIYLSEDIDEPAQAVFLHELSHGMENTKAYKDYKNTVTSFLNNDKYAEYKQRLVEKQALSAGVDPANFEIDPDISMSELTADLIGEFGKDEKFWKDINSESPEAAKGLIDAIVKLIRKLQAQIKKLSGKEADSVLSVVNDLEAVRAAAVKAVGSQIEKKGLPKKAVTEKKTLKKTTGGVDSDQTFKSTTPQGNIKISGTWAIYDADKILTSSDKGYNQSLQPRDRDTSESKLQIESIAKSPDPDRLEASPTTDVGAPIITEDGHALTGNGRILGIRKAYKTKRSKAYEAFVRERAKALGVDISKMKRPVLVRKLKNAGGAELTELADLSNRPQTLQMTYTEQAESDKNALLANNAALLKKFNPDVEGNIVVPSNMEFNIDFVSAVGDKSLLNSQGKPTAAVDERVKRAIMSAILSKIPNGKEIARKLIEQDAEIGIKRQIKGIGAVSGRLLTLAKTRPEFDLIESLGSALEDFVDYKSAVLAGKYNNDMDGREAFLTQGDIFDQKERSPEVVSLFHTIAAAKSIKQLRGYFDRYANLAESEDVKTVDMFGKKVSTVNELLERAGETDQTPSLFDAPAAEAKPEPKQKKKIEKKTEAPKKTLKKQEIKKDELFSKDDISFEIARDAYRGISHSPEKRADQERQAYYDNMKDFYNELKTKTPAHKQDILDDEFREYKEGYLKKKLAVLGAKSRTMSSMITGAANFPTRSNQKKMDTESKRTAEFLEWDKKATKKVKQNLEIIVSKVISSDDPDAITKLEKKIAKAESDQQIMKKANSIARKKSLTDTEKVKQLVELGLTEAAAKSRLTPDFGQKGFPSYMLTNNNANIKRMKARLNELNRKKGEATQELDFDGGQIVDNVEDNRVQILFEEKPNERVRTELRKRAFLWSPKNKAWQRKRTDRALIDAKEIVQTKETDSGVMMFSPKKKKVMSPEEKSKKMKLLKAEEKDLETKTKKSLKKVKSLEKDLKKTQAKEYEKTDYKPIKKTIGKPVDERTSDQLAYGKKDDKITSIKYDKGQEEKFIKEKTAKLEAVKAEKKEVDETLVQPELGDDITKFGFSLSDKAYKKAVDAKDMEKAQKMIDAAAKKVGYDIKGFHGTRSSFTQFKKRLNYKTKTAGGEGHFFSSNERVAEGYAKHTKQKGNVIKAFIKSPNHLVLEGTGTWNQYWINDEFAKKNNVDLRGYRNEGDTDWQTDKRGWWNGKSGDDAGMNNWPAMINIPTISVFAKKAGYSGVTIKNVSDAKRAKDKDLDQNTIIVYNPNHIKSSEPVAYDDDGEIIPLSKRFDPEKEDIRFATKKPAKIAKRDVAEKIVKPAAEKVAEQKKLEGEIKRTTTRGIFSNVIELAMRKQRQIHGQRSLESVIRTAFRDIADDYKRSFSKWRSALQSVENQIADIDAAIETKTGDAREAEIKKHLEGMLGRRYKTIRGLSKGDAEKTLEYLRKEMRTQLNRYYSGRLTNLLSRVKHDKLYNEPDTDLNFREQWDAIIANLGKHSILAGKYNQASNHLKYLRSTNALNNIIDKQKEKSDDLKQKLFESLNREQDHNVNRELYKQLSAIYANSNLMQEDIANVKGILRGDMIGKAKKEIAAAKKELKKKGRLTPKTRGILKNLGIDARGDMDTWLLNMTAGDENTVIYNVLKRNMQEADNKAKRDIVAGDVAFHEFLVRAGIATKENGNYKIDLKKLHGMMEVGKGKERTLADGSKHIISDVEIMNLYALTLREESFAKLKKNGFKVQDQKGMWGPKYHVGGIDVEETEDIITDLVNRLTPEQKKLTEDMVNYVSKIGIKGNKTALKVFGHEKFLEDMHWRMDVDRKNIPKAKEAQLEQIKDMPSSLTEMGMLKDTVPHSHPLLLGNIFDTFHDQVYDMARFTNMTIPLQDALAVLDDSDVKTLTAERFGTKYDTRIRDSLLRLAGLRKHSDEWKWIDRFASSIHRRVAISILGYNPTSFLTNRVPGSFGMMAELAKVDPKIAASYMSEFLNVKDAKVFKFSKGDEAIKNKMLFSEDTGYFYDRWQIHPAKTYANLPTEQDDIGTLKTMNRRNRQAMGLHLMAVAEMKNAVQAFKALKTNGYSDKEAIRIVENATRRSQNPSTAMEESGLYSELKKSPLLALVFPFYGQPSVYANMMLKDMMKKDKTAFAYSAVSLILSTAFVSAMRYAWAVTRKAAWGDDDDDEKQRKKQRGYVYENSIEEILDNAFVAGSGRFAMYGKELFKIGKKAMEKDTPVEQIGSAITGVKNLASGYSNEKMDMLWTRIPKRFTSGVEKTYQGATEKDYVELTNGLLDFADGLGASFGEPTGGITKSIKLGMGIAGLKEKKKIKRKSKLKKSLKRKF